MQEEVDLDTKESSLVEAIEAWKSLRDDVREREKAFKESMAEDKATVDILESDVLEMLRAAKLQSVKIDGVGLAYKSKRTSAKVENSEAFFRFVIDSERTELLEARANKKEVEEYVEMNAVPPPGVIITVEETLCFRSKQ
jgi:hypothetical protein